MRIRRETREKREAVIKWTCPLFSPELLETISRAGNNTALGSHRHGPVATSSFHQAVQVGELVFDNLNPNGIKFADWVADLYTNGGFKLNITPF
jgi:hypothetical protein